MILCFVLSSSCLVCLFTIIKAKFCGFQIDVVFSILMISIFHPSPILVSADHALKLFKMYYINPLSLLIYLTSKLTLYYRNAMIVCRKYYNFFIILPLIITDTIFYLL